MSKKRTKKAGSRKKAGSKKSSPRKGSRRPFKSKGGKRGIRKSLALSKKARRARRAANATSSGTALAVASKEAKKREFLERMAKARAARATVGVPAGFKGALPGLTGFVDLGTIPGPSKPRRRKKTSGKKRKPVSAGGSKMSKVAKKKRRKSKGRRAAAAARKTTTTTSKKRRRIGRPGKSRRATTQKFKLMHQWGFPSRRPLAGTKRKALRTAAGGTVTAKQILDTIRAEKLKSWVCVGPRRTGCGGGARNLRGGHQIGIFKSRF